MYGSGMLEKRVGRGLPVRVRCQARRGGKLCDQSAFYYRDEARRKYCDDCQSRISRRAKPAPQEPRDISRKQIELRFQAAQMIKRRKRLQELAKESLK